jgi:UDP-N-acetylmuramoyl-L-alanyl-D-glutamate--2,6-diaminopimelate ligase
MLKELLYKVNIQSISGDTEIEIKNLQTDSRKVTSGSCFIALTGTQVNGNAFISDAIKRGAVAIVTESMPDILEAGITYISVQNAATAAGIICNNFFGAPDAKMKIVGVTGTNGKTTIATLLWKLFSSLGYRCGLVSTIHNRIADQIIESTHTTPDVVSLYELLHDMMQKGCTHVFMECSSHAIHQKRIAGLNFAAAIFSNITHDHLDYHKTFDEYISVKKSWFDQLSSDCIAISNADDKRGAVMLQNTAAKRKYYSLKTIAEIKGKILDNSLEGLHMNINDIDVHFKLIGEFNAYNLLAVFATAVFLGEDKRMVLEALSSLAGAEGRFDYLISDKDHIVGIVDYAHTPDALLNVLATIKKLRQGNQKIISVVGCGGNRDATKRPLMAEVACLHSDKVVFTSDNPRFEDPSAIINQMESGVNVVARKKYLSIPDRREAIKAAVNLCDKKDILLLAGKGHEKYQEIKGIKYEFDDKKVLSETFDLLER